MNQFTENREQDNKLIQKITYYASFQPFMGISLSMISSLFLLFQDKPWSWGMVCYEFVPSAGFLMIYFIIAIYMKIKHNLTVPFFNKKIKAFTIFLFLVLIGLNVLLWKMKSVI